MLVIGPVNVLPQLTAERLYKPLSRAHVVDHPLLRA